MRFSDVSSASADVASLSGRLQKVGRLAELLARLSPDEIEPTVAFLSGTTRHGRIGIGHAAIAATFDVPPAEEAPSDTTAEAAAPAAAVEAGEEASA